MHFVQLHSVTHPKHGGFVSLTIDPLRINDTAHFVRSSSSKVDLRPLVLRTAFGHPLRVFGHYVTSFSYIQSCTTLSYLTIFAVNVICISYCIQPIQELSMCLFLILGKKKDHYFSIVIFCISLALVLRHRLFHFGILPKTNHTLLLLIPKFVKHTFETISKTDNGYVFLKNRIFLRTFHQIVIGDART